MDRNKFAFYSTSKDNILEIGPSYQPVYAKKEGWNVDIVDHLPKSELIKKMAGQNIDAIEEVDFICTGRYSDAIPHRNYYDVIMGAHIIEHMLDLIDFFDDCDKLLTKDGIVKLIIPDCRYEFDCFREITSLRSVIDTHYWKTDKKMSAHTIGTLAEYQMLAVLIPECGTYIPNSSFLFDNRIRFAVDDPCSYAPGKNVITDYDENLYLDIHNWTFTPKSFELLIYELNVLGLVNFSVCMMEKDPDSIEFYVVLNKSDRGRGVDRTYMMNTLIDHKKEMLENMREYILQYGSNFMTAFYINTGSGYSEKRRISVSAMRRADGQFFISADLPSNTIKTRWDPVEGKHILLSNIEVKINGKHVEMRYTNGIPVKTGVLLFETSDPQLEFDVPSDDEIKISINGRMAFL